MITKAIVEEVVSPYQVKVRIPLLNGISSSTISTPSDELNIATICSLPNCLTNLQVGDVVFIGFEDNTHHKAVVLGCLLKEARTTSYADLELNDLIVHGKTTLPIETSIGNVTPDNIRSLEGISDNIQQQLNLIKEQQDVLADQLKEIIRYLQQ